MNKFERVSYVTSRAVNGVDLTRTRAGLYPFIADKERPAAAVRLHHGSNCCHLLPLELCSSIFLLSPDRMSGTIPTESSKVSIVANDMETTNYNELVELNDEENLEDQHNYPFNMCEHEFFEKLCNSLNPNFKLVFRNTIRVEVLITLTTDIWTSEQANIAYTCLTTYYVDDNWDLKKKILTYRHIPYPYDGETLF
ncbi:hypothetical protein M9H77_09605 [Catharanthus roseus]|uniref:Uncharacterized protein n=1 Tax=Catharanthus roseus TaxID=4058 RepID=A0ACC0C182_CATRO|nr:hypothetical protein M9H77_09605 [Catharanthus roseus]